jgi:HAD superfamily hydrolase (TIGR01549 family)
MARVLVLDVDGTLVDSNYQHVVAWQRALRIHGVDADAWKIHRYIGKGGDQMVDSVAGAETERRCGDGVRASESEIFKQLIGDVKPFQDAKPFVLEVADRGFEVVLASSAKSDEVEHYLGLLGVGDAISGHTTSADVEATKPHPDLVEAAIEKAGSRDALMIGDSIWDVEAAQRIGVPSLAVLTGGFSKRELEAAGANEVRPQLADLLDCLPA